MSTLLSVQDLSVDYGHEPVVHGISLEVAGGELVSLIGPNGAGKTSTLNGIMGLARVSKATRIGGPAGQDLSGCRTHVRARSGIAYIPEAAGVFTGLTVHQNLQLARNGSRPQGGLD